jgi:hypothetical protein
MIARRLAPLDARATQVRFTARGRRTIAKAVVAVEDADEAFFAGLDGPRLRHWLALSRDVIAHHQPQDAPPANGVRDVQGVGGQRRRVSS